MPRRAMPWRLDDQGDHIFNFYQAIAERVPSERYKEISLDYMQLIRAVNRNPLQPEGFDLETFTEDDGMTYIASLPEGVFIWYRLDEAHRRIEVVDCDQGWCSFR